MLKIVHQSNGTDMFRIRINDSCTNAECKTNKLTASGVAETEDKYYKVVARCDICGKFYAFTRINRRSVEDRARMI